MRFAPKQQKLVELVRNNELCVNFKIMDFVRQNLSSSPLQTADPHRLRKNRKSRTWNKIFTFGLRYVLVLPENAQTNRITLYSSKRPGVTFKNPWILPERPTFTMMPSYTQNRIYTLFRLKTAYTHRIHIFRKNTFQNLVFAFIPFLARRRRRSTLFYVYKFQMRLISALKIQFSEYFPRKSLIFPHLVLSAQIYMRKSPHLNAKKTLPTTYCKAEVGRISEHGVVRVAGYFLTRHQRVPRDLWKKYLKSSERCDFSQRSLS